MEYAPEGDLRKYTTKRKAPLSPSQGERFLRQSLEALDFVHATGVLHRDVKPDNILVMNEREVRLADFGLALLPGEDASIEEIQSGVGSFGYLPPEVLEGIQFDQRSDLYALGLCFYEMIAGTHPFEGASLIDQLEIRQDKKLTPLNTIVPDVSSHLNTIVMKLLRYSPDDRFSNALEALKAINNPDYVESAKPQTARKKTNVDDTSTEKATLDEGQGTASAPAAVISTPTATTHDPLAEAITKELDSSLSAATGNASPSNAANTDIPVGGRIKEEPPTTSLDSSPVTEGNAAIAVQEPEVNKDLADEDAVEAKNVEVGERIPQPTEKIDLERIKDIIAKDAQQKADAARRRATQTQNISRNKDSLRVSTSVGRQKSGSVVGGSSTSSSGESPGFIQAAIASFTKIPHALRPVVVGLGAAVTTIMVVFALQIFSSGGNEPPLENSKETSVATTITGIENSGSSGASPIESTTTELPPEASFPALPGGLFAGHISGVLPGFKAPFALISLPKQGMLSVMVGIEGWSPVLVPSTNSAGEPILPLVVRSNGMILNLTGSVASGIIEGTFANAVTGETGTWQVKKVS
jgi:serine/threonine protein kinase